MTSVLPPHPQSVMVEITSTFILTFSWTPPSDTSNLEGYMLTVTGEECGCVNINVSTDNTSVNCTDWAVNNQTCSFEIVTISQDCGFTSDPMNLTLLLSGM